MMGSLPRPVWARWCLALLLASCLVPALAPPPLVAAETPASGSDCRVLMGATVYLPEGPSPGAAVVISGDRIVGAGSEVPGLGSPGVDGSTIAFGKQICALEDLGGKVVTAGLIDPATHLGLVEISLEPGTRDMSWDTGGPVRTSLQVADAYNPRSSLIPIARIEGITSAVIRPRGGLIAGQGAGVDLAGGSQAVAVVNPSVAVYADLGATSSRAASLKLLREVLDDARYYARNGRAHEQNRIARDFSASFRDLSALSGVVDSSVPLVVHADRAADIEALLRLARDENIRLVISGAAEGWLLAEALAAASVPVILDSLVYGPGSFNQIEARPDNAALLREAGVTILLSTWSSHFTRNLRQRAGNAVRGGLDHTEALRAITSAPATVFGLTGRGTLAPGSVANVVVWSGDPLELSSRVLRLFIRGRDVPLVSRQTELRDRYRSLPGTPLSPLPLLP